MVIGQLWGHKAVRYKQTGERVLELFICAGQEQRGHFLCTTDVWSIRACCRSCVVFHLHLTFISLLGSKSHQIRKAKQEKQNHAEMPADCPKALRPLLLPVPQKRELHSTPESDTFCMNLHLTQTPAAHWNAIHWVKGGKEFKGPGATSISCVNDQNNEPEIVVWSSSSLQAERN